MSSVNIVNISLGYLGNYTKELFNTALPFFHNLSLGIINFYFFLQ